jgi:beta-N-acetylhexosaminidase
MSGRSASPDRVRLGGRLLGVGVSGTRLTAEETRILRNVSPAAVVLFARNVESLSQVVELVASIRETLDPAPVFMIDEEGGRVDRMRSLVPGIPGAADIGACADSGASREHGRVIGRLLAEIDIEVNLAPVVDIWRDGLSPSLVGRCFGTDPGLVAEGAGAFIAGMAECGVLSCLKHFPGLGVAATDPHHASSVVDLTMAELEATDLVPYRSLAASAPAVMVSHTMHPAIDKSGLPGTLSTMISTTLLRERIGFEGLAITDDMEMHAVSERASAPEIASQSVMAGNDLVIFCSRISEAESIAARLGALSESDASAVRLEQATGRVDRFVNLCGAWAERRDRARRGIEEVKEAVARLRASIGLA